MKITALLVFKCNNSNTESSTETDPIILANASDVSQFGYFQRNGVKEFIVFFGRTVAKRTSPAQRQSIQHEEYKVHSYNQNGLCAVGFMDDHYPVRSAFSLLNKVLDEYHKIFGDTWKNAQADATVPWQFLNDSLTKFQDPAEADKLLKIQRELDETKIILHKTIDSVLERGEKLDSLVEKSSDLSAASQALLLFTWPWISDTAILQAGKENQPMLYDIIDKRLKTRAKDVYTLDQELASQFNALLRTSVVKIYYV